MGGLSIEVVRRFQPKSIVKTCIDSHIAEYPSHSFFIFWMYQRVGYMSIGLTFVKHRHGVIARKDINNSIPTRTLKGDIAFCHTDFYISILLNNINKEYVLSESLWCYL